MSQKKAKIPKSRMSAAERRQMIILRAGALFAQKGIHGVTTKEIAKACEVSEPVLYQHFKTKEEIYNELHTFCKSDTTFMKMALRRREASTETLCFFVYMTTSVVSLSRLPGEKGPSQDAVNIVRLSGYSFLEDGNFMKVVLRDCIESLFEDWSKSYRAAFKSQDLEVKSLSEKELWIAYELMVGSALFQQVGAKILPIIHGDESDYLERMSLFILRGLGVKEAAIKQHFKPKSFLSEILKLSSPTADR